MAKDRRTYITLVDTMPEHPKVELLSDAAFRLLVESWAYCSRNRTDGRIDARVWARRGTAEARAELETPLDDSTLPLVEVVAGGVQMHDYLDHQRSAAEIEAQRAVNAENGRKGGLAKAKRSATDSVPNRQASASEPLSGSVSENVPVSVSVSVSDLPSGGATEAAEESAKEDTRMLVGEWIDHCPGGRPPDRVIGQVSKELKAMLVQGIPFSDVRDGLAQWHALGLHPSALASAVHELRTAGARRAPARRGGPNLDAAMERARQREEAQS